MMVVILTPVDGIIRWLPRGFSCSPFRIKFDKAYYKVVLSMFNLFIKPTVTFYDWEWYQYCTHKQRSETHLRVRSGDLFFLNGIN